MTAQRPFGRPFVDKHTDPTSHVLAKTYSQLDRTKFRYNSLCKICVTHILQHKIIIRSFRTHPKIEPLTTTTNHPQRDRTCHVYVHTGHEDSGAIHAVNPVGQYVLERHGYAVRR